MLMYHCMKKINSPIEISVLAELGKEAHGRSLWKDTVDGQRELVFFDGNTKECVSPSEFRSRQLQRARERARSYPNGRKLPSDAWRVYSFLWG